MTEGTCHESLSDLALIDSLSASYVYTATLPFDLILSYFSKKFIRPETVSRFGDFMYDRIVNIWVRPCGERQVFVCFDSTT